MASEGRPETVATASDVGDRLAAACRLAWEQREQSRVQLAGLREANRQIGREAATRRIESGTALQRPRLQIAAVLPPTWSRITAAETLLRTVLAAGPVPTVEVERRALTAGISMRTLARARRRVGVRAVRAGGFGDRGAWYCRLAADPPAR